MRAFHAYSSVAFVTCLLNGPALAQSQCATAQGEWDDNYTFRWSLSQFLGIVSGTVTFPEGQCSANSWPVTGNHLGANGAFQLTATNPEYGNDEFGCVEYFVYNATLRNPGCNVAIGWWLNTGGQSGYARMDKPCDQPSGEVNQPGNWSTQFGRRTLFLWKPYIFPVTTNFGGRYVSEYGGAYGPGNDSCHAGASVIPEFDGPTGLHDPANPGSSGLVDQLNEYRDYVGYTEAATHYYRALGRAPCGTAFEQYLYLDCANAPNPLFGYNVLGAVITETTVISIRGGDLQEREFVLP